MIKVIDKSHSKKDLKEIIEIFYFQYRPLFEEYEDMNKNQLVKAIITQLNNLETIVPDFDILLIKDKYELIKYLETPNQDKVLSIKEKNDIMKISKRIISFVKNGCSITSSSFKDAEDLDKACNTIREHGNIPTCRRAISLMNKTYSFHNKYKLNISKRVQRELTNKKDIKQECLNKFKASRGEFVVTFS